MTNHCYILCSVIFCTVLTFVYWVFLFTATLLHCYYFHPTPLSVYGEAIVFLNAGSMVVHIYAHLKDSPFLFTLIFVLSNVLPHNHVDADHIHFSLSAHLHVWHLQHANMIPHAKKQPIKDSLWYHGGEKHSYIFMKKHARRAALLLLFWPIG